MKDGDYPFPSCGEPGDRLFTVGTCQVCGLALVHEERDGPPQAQDYCSFHDPKWAPPRRDQGSKRNAKHKTEGEMILERVCARHKDGRGIGAIKMPAAARQDLIDEINGALDG